MHKALLQQKSQQNKYKERREGEEERGSTNSARRKGSRRHPKKTVRIEKAIKCKYLIILHGRLPDQFRGLK